MVIMREDYEKFDVEGQRAVGEEQKIAAIQSVGESMVSSVYRHRVEYGNPSMVTTRAVVFKQLLEMGYSKGLVESLLRNTEVRDIETAVEMITKSEAGWMHGYIPNQENTACIICQEPLIEHVEYKFDHEDRYMPLPVPGSTPLKEWPLEMLQEQIQDTNTLECKICWRSVSVRETFGLQCGHIHCRGCVVGYLDSSITEGRILNLKCPEENCDMKFTREHVRELCSPAMFDKYLRFRENIEVNLNKRLRWCPAPNCGRYVEAAGSDGHVVCVCGFELCFKCGEAWHPRLSCHDYFDKMYSRWASSKLIQRCPHCHIRIEKNAGCNHMTCTFCSHAWCWICGMEYNDGHYDSAFFGCTGLQFTSDWGLGRILFIQTLILLFWPLACFFCSGKRVCEIFGNVLRDCSQWTGILCPIITVLYVCAVVLCFAIMILPSFFYRLYVFGYSILRYCRT